MDRVLHNLDAGKGQPESTPWSVAPSAVVQGSARGASSSSDSQFVGASGAVGFRFPGRMLRDSSSEDEAVQPKSAKVPRRGTVSNVLESDSDGQ